MTATTLNDDLIVTHLQCAVPLQVACYERRGGPTEDERAMVRSYVDPLLFEHGQDLPYKGPHTRRAIGEVVEMVALLSYQPGGVRMCGLRFETVGGACVIQPLAVRAP